MRSNRVNPLTDVSGLSSPASQGSREARGRLTVAFALTKYRLGETYGENNPAVAYLEADVRDPGPLLRAAEQHFNGERKVAIGFIGVAYFIDDASLERTLRTLHDWASPGSVLALSLISVGGPTESGRQRAEALKRSGAELFPRSEATLRRLAPPWEVRELAPLESWSGVETRIQESDREHPDTGMFGAVLVRGG